MYPLVLLSSRRLLRRVAAVFCPLAILTCLLGAARAQQATATTIHRFSSQNGNGTRSPSGLVQGSDGNFYGFTSPDLDQPGTIYQLTPDHVYKTLHVLHRNTDGTTVAGTLVEGPDGAFYGVTADGGTSSVGSIFRVTTDGEFSTNFSFDSTGSNMESPTGYIPNGPLTVEANGTLYGTTQFGGPAFPSGGAAFELRPDGTYTILDVFVGVYTAKMPIDGLIRRDGDFYGVTAEGGVGGGGAIVRLAPPGGTTTLHTFGYGTDGTDPAGTLVQRPDGTLYGATVRGGAAGLGTLFSITPDGSTYATLHDFSGNADGGQPAGGLVLATDHNLYGVTASGGKYGYGTFFRLTPAGAFKTLFSFTKDFDGVPNAPLIQGTDGAFYGTTDGAVYEITVSAHAPFFTGETDLGSGVYYLQFPDGTPFGYYSYLSDPPYLYHFDLGYEYVFDAADGQDGVYLYDFTSQTFFYTSPSFPFPYLYDFTLDAVLYYYPDTANPGHYTTNPRYFYDFNLGVIFTM